MNGLERRETLRDRQSRKVPWHDIPCRDSGKTNYLISVACYEHRAVIGARRSRMTRFGDDLILTTGKSRSIRKLHAWVVLPNHYHLLCEVDDIRATKTELGKLHGRTSFQWNREDETKGRKVWFRAAETVIKSPGHFQASLNYIHQNPAKHRCVEVPDDWPWSSLKEWRASLDPEEADDLWRAYPTDRYGKGWDDESLADVAAKLLE